MTLPKVFLASAAQDVEPILEAYQSLGGLAFGYGQGSVFMGFVNDSDLDISLIWDRDEVPYAPEIQGATERTRFNHQDAALDKMQINGRPVDVIHHTTRTFDGWCEQVAGGDGWQTDVWPLPLYAVSGFAYGVTLVDKHGAATAARSHVDRFPERLVERSYDVLTTGLPSYDKELTDCVRRSDGWLFHSLLTKLLRTTYVAWFASHRRYCPHPKWLSAWVDRFDIDDGIACLDYQLWASSDLAQKRNLAHTIAEQVLSGAQPRDDDVSC